MSLRKLPGRWRRESSEMQRLARQRSREGRPDAAHRLLVRADTWLLAADELEQELAHDPPVHTAPE